MSLETEISDAEIFAEEDLPESVPHSILIQYLFSVLEWLYRAEGWFISNNLAIVYTPGPYLAPDLALFKRVVLTYEELKNFTSYRLSQNGRTPPAVVFEILSKDTWKEDLQDKPEKYGQMGVTEYFAYDPQVPQSRKNSKTRLKGWRYEGGQIIELTPDSRGWLWSKELDSWLGSNETMLRIYDSQSQLRLNQVEAERAAKEAERIAKELVRSDYELLLEKLRKANIDPDKL